MKIMAKRLWLAAFVLLSSSGAANATLYPAETKNLRPDSARDLCMDLSGDARLAKCNSSNAQKITLERRETGERRMRVGSQCVEGNREGEALFLAPCRSVVTQTWTYNNTGQIRNGNGLCVDVYQNRKTAGTPVITYRCNGTINQRWARYDVPRPETPPGSASTMSFRPAHARDKCLDVTPEDVPWWAKPEVHIHLWPQVDHPFRRRLPDRRQPRCPGSPEKLRLRTTPVVDRREKRTHRARFGCMPGYQHGGQAERHAGSELQVHGPIQPEIYCDKIAPARFSAAVRDPPAIATRGESSGITIACLAGLSFLA
jgi:hypothetical protein